jgi:hypothetical protein
MLIPPAMLRNIILTLVVWTGIALVAGIVIGRWLRRRTPAPQAGQKAGFRNSALSSPGWRG